jgi:hypothetical protein
MNYDIITHIATFFSPKEAFQRSIISNDWYLALQYKKSTHIKKIMKQAKSLHMLNNLCPCILERLGFNNQLIKSIFPNDLLLLACRYSTTPQWFKYLYAL